MLGPRNVELLSNFASKSSVNHAMEAHMLKDKIDKSLYKTATILMDRFVVLTILNARAATGHEACWDVAAASAKGFTPRTRLEMSMLSSWHWLLDSHSSHRLASLSWSLHFLRCYFYDYK